MMYLVYALRMYLVGLIFMFLNTLIMILDYNVTDVNVKKSLIIRMLLWPVMLPYEWIKKLISLRMYFKN